MVLINDNDVVHVVDELWIVLTLLRVMPLKICSCCCERHYYDDDDDDDDDDE